MFASTLISAHGTSGIRSRQASDLSRPRLFNFLSTASFTSLTVHCIVHLSQIAFRASATQAYNATRWLLSQQGQSFLTNNILPVSTHT